MDLALYVIAYVVVVMLYYTVMILYYCETHLTENSCPRC